MQGRTTLILAHRLSSVIDCDRILVLDGGKVAEHGHHDDLMAKHGVYAGLMAEQVRESSAGAATDSFGAPARVETVADTPGGAIKPLTEGIIKAEGLTWYQVVAALMKVIRRGRASSRHLHPGACYARRGLHRRRRAVGLDRAGAEAPRAFETSRLRFATAPCRARCTGSSRLAHDGRRLLAEMRIDAFASSTHSLPPIRARRRTGDLMAPPHTTSNLSNISRPYGGARFVAIPVPAVVIAALARQTLGLRWRCCHSYCRGPAPS
jgi:ATP-binding cassette subfamily C protein CydCD